MYIEVISSYAHTRWSARTELTRCVTPQNFRMRICIRTRMCDVKREGDYAISGARKGVSTRRHNPK